MYKRQKHVSKPHCPCIAFALIIYRWSISLWLKKFLLLFSANRNLQILNILLMRKVLVLYFWEGNISWIYSDNECLIFAYKHIRGPDAISFLFNILWFFYCILILNSPRKWFKFVPNAQGHCLNWRTFSIYKFEDINGS